MEWVAHYETLYLFHKYAIIEISNNLDEIFMVVNIHSYLLLLYFTKESNR